MHGDTHREEVGAAFGLLPDGCGGVSGLRDIDAELLLAGAGCGGHRRRVVAQAAAAAVTGLGGQKQQINARRAGLQRWLTAPFIGSSTGM